MEGSPAWDAGGDAEAESTGASDFPVFEFSAIDSPEGRFKAQGFLHQERARHQPSRGTRNQMRADDTSAFPP